MHDGRRRKLLEHQEALHFVLSAVQKVMPHAKVAIDVEAGQAMTWKTGRCNDTCASSRMDANTSRMVQY